MRAVRERPRVFVVVGWAALALLLAGTLIGATAAGGGAAKDRQALEDARHAALEARAEAEDGERDSDRLARALKAERHRATGLTRELRSARRDARRAGYRKRR